VGQLRRQLTLSCQVIEALGHEFWRIGFPVADFVALRCLAVVHCQTFRVRRYAACPAKIRNRLRVELYVRLLVTRIVRLRMWFEWFR